MTQNNLNEEIERAVKEYESTFLFSVRGLNRTVEREKIKFLRQSLASIAEKTVEAVRVEPIETAERIVMDYANITGRDETMRPFVREAAIKVLIEQTNLAKRWLGKE